MGHDDDGFCYDNELKKAPGLGGKLVVSITVAASGRVTVAFFTWTGETGLLPSPPGWVGAVAIFSSVASPSTRRPKAVY